MYLKKISENTFLRAIARDEKVERAFLLAYFADTIEEYKKFAFAPYFWLIPETQNLTIACASENIHQFTPYSKKQWEEQGVHFWISMIHPEDREFFMSAIAMSAKLNETPPVEKSRHLISSIYCRMINAQQVYRWVLIQFPNRLYNEDGKVISTLILTVDLSHLSAGFTKMMTVFDPSSNENQYFLAHVENQELNKLEVPSLSKRECEIIKEMAKGLNTPQIAEKLFISYHTVENHKRNLRAKTNTKTSAELMNFVWSNGLI